MKILIDKEKLENLNISQNKEYNDKIIQSILQQGEEYNENEANGDLNDLFHEYSHSKTKQTFESFVVNEKGYKLIKL